ncbi:MAG: hypothetical protein ACRCW4_14135 [Candidatus Neomicrothrix subdominans]
MSAAAANVGWAGTGNTVTVQRRGIYTATVQISLRPTTNITGAYPYMGVAQILHNGVALASQSAHYSFVAGTPMMLNATFTKFMNVGDTVQWRMFGQTANAAPLSVLNAALTPSNATLYLVD